MPDPDVMADIDMMLAAPFEELGVVLFVREIGARAIGKVRLRGAVHRMIARVDPGHRRDRAEFSNCRVGDLRVVHDIGVIVHGDFEQNGARPDFGIDRPRAGFPAPMRWGQWSVQPKASCPSFRIPSSNADLRTAHVFGVLDDNVMTGA